MPSIGGICRKLISHYLWAGVLLFAGCSLTAQTPQRSTTGFVGSEVCRNCHPAQWNTFFRNPHFKSIAGNYAPELNGCEGCHGPGAGHVQAEARFKTRTIIAFSQLNPRQALDNCLKCHSRDFNRAEIRRSEHTQHDVACTSCHSIHSSPTPKFLLAKDQASLCYNCHAQVRAQFNMPFKHRVNEGMMTCTDCHNPHGTPAPAWRMSARPRMVEHSLGNEQPCLRCHADLRGPFLFEHPAVRIDGCEACHFPHGSTNARLLRRPVVHTICLECHN